MLYVRKMVDCMNNIKLEQDRNIRDLGGIVNRDGLKIKNGLFVRSSHLGDFSDNDLTNLKNNYNINTIIDLRNKGEVLEMPDRLLDGMKYFHIPILSGSRAGLSHEKSGVSLDKVPNMCELYRGMAISETSRRQMKKILKIIMDSKRQCVLFHCTIGKDRTGIIALLILTMLDVPIETIYEDYLYTNVITEPEALELRQAIIDKTHNEEYADEVKDTHLAQKEYMDSIIEYMEEEYGSVLGFILYGVKINKRKIDKFKKASLEETVEIF